MTGILIRLLLIRYYLTQNYFSSCIRLARNVIVRYFVFLFKYFCLSPSPRDVALRRVPDPEHHPAGDTGRGQPAGAQPVVRIQVHTQI